MGEQDRYRGQDPDDLYSTREEDAYASGDEMSSSMGSSESRGTDEPSMRQEQGGQGYGQGPRGQQDEPGFEGGGHGFGQDDEYSSEAGMHDEDMTSRRPRRQDDEDELYGNQLDDMHDRDDETGENW